MNREHSDAPFTAQHATAGLSNPTDVAREALRRLAVQRIVPTPENYRAVYCQIAGAGEHEAAERQPHPGCAGEPSGPIRPLSRNHAADQRSAASCESEFREMLAELLTSPLLESLAAPPDLVAEAKTLASLLREANASSTHDLLKALRTYFHKLEIQADNVSEERAGLLRLLRLLIENLGDLVTDDGWIRQQVDAVRKIIAAPVNLEAMHEAECFLKEVIDQQSAVKNSLRQAQSTLKLMVSQVIERLTSYSQYSQDYSGKLEAYCKRISSSGNLDDLNDILSQLLEDTQSIQQSTDASRAAIIDARDAAAEAERKIRTLEADLVRITEKVREDQLTGTLNRHGLQDAFDRERARARRTTNPLSLALLDLDDFKHLNDSYGHRTGDSALIHLVKVMRSTMRPTDVICRYGGEEFVILMANTNADEALQAMVRLQRQLTREFFLHDTKHTLITFSAGVTLCHPGESQEDAIGRADKALYESKKSGKNRTTIAS